MLKKIEEFIHDQAMYLVDEFKHLLEHEEEK